MADNTFQVPAMESKDLQKLLQEALASKDIWKVMGILAVARTGLLDYICNELFNFPDKDIELFIPQLCTRVLKDPTAQSLERFLFDKCSNLHLAFKMFFWFQAAEEDGSFSKQRCHWLGNECEMAAVNSKSRTSLRMMSYVREKGREITPSLSLPGSPKPTSPRSMPRSSSTTALDQGDNPEPFALFINQQKSTENIKVEAQQFSAHSFEDKRVLIAEVPPSSPNSRRSSAPPQPNFAVEELELTQSTSNSTSTSLSTPPSTPTKETIQEIKSGKEEPKPMEKQNSSSTTTSSTSTQNSQSKPKRTPSSSDVKLVVPPSPSRGSGPIELLDADNINSKKSRHFYFHAQLHFLSCLSSISSQLKKYSFRTKAEYNFALSSLLKQLQKALIDENKLGTEFYGNQGLYLPIGIADGSHSKIVRLLPDDSFCLNSKDRVPFMLFVEVISAEPIKKKENEPETPPNTPSTATKHETGLIEALEKMITFNRELKEAEAKKKQQEKYQDEEWILMHATSNESKGPIALAFPELWNEKIERIRKTSPYREDPNWKLISIIVKSGDDLRQEQLAMQLISAFDQIFKDAELPLWLRPYSVIATSSNTGIIETVPDAISIDALKKRFPNMTCLEDYFVVVYGEKTSIKFLQAQRNFVESLAAYSIVCYLLQIKDRHNGNILIDKEGHVIHIDYGFMLSSSPGSLNFESAPFKLTNEFIQLMGGERSDMFHYFKLMFIRGFLEVRKHAHRILLLVEMLLPGQKMGCFARREATVRELKERFQLQLSTEDTVTFVLNLIRDSVGRWSTNAYDNYQWFWNGIVA